MSANNTVQYNAWYCGHITPAVKGSTASRNGTNGPDAARNIEEKDRNMCPDCYAKYLAHRLNYVDMLVNSCLKSYNETKNIERQLKFVKAYRAAHPDDLYNTKGSEFKEYSPEFSNMIARVVDIEEHGFDNEIAGYVDAASRFRRVFVAEMTEMVRRLRQDAVKLAQTGGDGVVNQCAHIILRRVADIMKVLVPEPDAADKSGNF
ncbi:hypothetical protein F4861DRAFT_379312 [Xylaria intraflava]|nr:hypothetical protein F4861DRAFT_379312 [Xylaria intraflava]